MFPFSFSFFFSFYLAVTFSFFLSSIENGAGETEREKERVRASSRRLCRVITPKLELIHYSRKRAEGEHSRAEMIGEGGKGEMWEGRGESGPISMKPNYFFAITSFV